MREIEQRRCDHVARTLLQLRTAVDDDLVASQTLLNRIWKEAHIVHSVAFCIVVDLAQFFNIRVEERFELASFASGASHRNWCFAAKRCVPGEYAGPRECQDTHRNSTWRLGPERGNLCSASEASRRRAAIRGPFSPPSYRPSAFRLLALYVVDIKRTGPCDVRACLSCTYVLSYFGPGRPECK
jgi:hypothetical protein